MLATDYPLADIIWTMVVFFAWVMWIYLLIVVFADLFGRHDVSGWGKAGWTVFVLLLPFIGVLCYVGFDGKGMAERKANQMAQSQAQFDTYVRDVAGSGGAASEIANAKQLLDSGAITQIEFDDLKSRALAHA